MADEQAHTISMFGDDQPELAPSPVEPAMQEAAVATKREPLLMIMYGHYFINFFCPRLRNFSFFHVAGI